MLEWISMAALTAGTASGAWGQLALNRARKLPAQIAGDSPELRELEWRKRDPDAYALKHTEAVTDLVSTMFGHPDAAIADIEHAVRLLETRELASIHDLQEATNRLRGRPAGETWSLWVSVHTANPLLRNDTEPPVGKRYGRIEITALPARPKLSVPAGRYTHTALWTQRTGGLLLGVNNIVVTVLKNHGTLTVTLAETSPTVAGHYLRGSRA